MGLVDWLRKRKPKAQDEMRKKKIASKVVETKREIKETEKISEEAGDEALNELKKMKEELGRNEVAKKKLGKVIKGRRQILEKLARIIKITHKVASAAYLRENIGEAHHFVVVCEEAHKELRGEIIEVRENLESAKKLTKEEEERLKELEELIERNERASKFALAAYGGWDLDDEFFHEKED